MDAIYRISELPRRALILYVPVGMVSFSPADMDRRRVFLIQIQVFFFQILTGSKTCQIKVHAIPELLFPTIDGDAWAERETLSGGKK